MTTLISSASPDLKNQQQKTSPEAKEKRASSTLTSSFIFLIVSIAIVLSTMAYGTVHSWSLGFFQAGAAILLVLWMVDAITTKVLKVTTNRLLLPLLAVIALGSLQIATGISQDSYSTRIVLVQIGSLLIYFAAFTTFLDTPRRFRVMTYSVIIFGFLLAMFGLVQSYTSPTKIYWTREYTQALPFGPYVNRHHFAGYMELALGLPLGLLISGGAGREKGVLALFAILVMTVSLLMTGSRGGVISLAGELGFLSILWFFFLRKRTENKEGYALRSILLKMGLVVILLSAVIGGLIYVGGQESVDRLVGRVNSADPTSGRTHFWKVTLDIIRDHPVLGTGLGSFGVVYTKYDTQTGMLRLEQAHNDYLQVLSDAGIAGGIIGASFLLILFGTGIKRLQTQDGFRRGVTAGALAGCFAVLVHSLFDFTLHTTANALLFLILCGLATVGTQVEEIKLKRRKRRHHSHEIRSEVRKELDPVQSYAERQQTI
jgi:O-antigen ligase